MQDTTLYQEEILIFWYQVHICSAGVLYMKLFASVLLGLPTWKVLPYLLAFII
jgi:hypothetical protein